MWVRIVEALTPSTVAASEAVGAPRYERWRVGVELLSFIAEG
jgi:hypothetical protein